MLCLRKDSYVPLVTNHTDSISASEGMAGDECSLVVNVVMKNAVKCIIDNSY